MLSSRLLFKNSASKHSLLVRKKRNEKTAISYWWQNVPRRPIKKLYDNVVFGCFGRGGRFRSDGGERERERKKDRGKKRERVMRCERFVTLSMFGVCSYCVYLCR